MNTIARPDHGFYPTHLPEFDPSLEPNEGRRKKKGRRRVAARRLCIVVVAVLAGLVGVGYSSKSSRDANAEAV
jgi:cell division septal protein FtsQ